MQHGIGIGVVQADMRQSAGAADRKARKTVDAMQRNLLEEIQSVYESLYCDHQGILRVRITSASRLETRQVDAIKERLKKKYEKDIEPAVDEDPSLIGGLQIRVGDTIFDHSIASRLQAFKRKLINA